MKENKFIKCEKCGYYPVENGYICTSCGHKHKKEVVSIEQRKEASLNAIKDKTKNVNFKKIFKIGGFIIVLITLIAGSVYGINTYLENKEKAEQERIAKIEAIKEAKRLEKEQNQKVISNYTGEYLAKDKIGKSDKFDYKIYKKENEYYILNNSTFKEDIINSIDTVTSIIYIAKKDTFEGFGNINKDGSLYINNNAYYLKNSIAYKNTMYEENLKDTLFLISDKCAGLFINGKPIPENLPDNIQVKDTIEITKGEGMVFEEHFFIVKQDGMKLLTFSTALKSEASSEKVIYDLTILSNKFKTKEGIRIGSTIEEFIKVFPDYKIWYTYISDRYVIQAKKSSTQFILNNDDFIGKVDVKSEVEYVKISDFKPNSKIVKIRVL